MPVDSLQNQVGPQGAWHGFHSPDGQTWWLRPQNRPNIPPPISRIRERLQQRSCRATPKRSDANVF
jgi:hypothetical protein